MKDFVRNTSHQTVSDCGSLESCCNWLADKQADDTTQLEKESEVQEELEGIIFSLLILVQMI
jgi:hypothetical protein